jgi:hypothetical protein
MPNDRLSKILSGVAGQFFVAAELSRRGYIATLTLRNTRGVDMLVAAADASASVGIQVKTNQGSRKEWLMDKKAEESAMENLLYIFVNLNGTTGTPTYHVVPSQVVADYTRKSHRDWLAGTPVRGTERKDTSMRKFEDASGEYLGKWEVLSSLLRNMTD